MSRSVSYPIDAKVAYRELEGEYEEEFEDFVDFAKDMAQTLWPSLEPCSKWLGREDHAVLKNGLVYFGVSCYYGLVVCWLSPVPGKEGLAKKWISRVENKFDEVFGTLRKIGTASNGESFYERIKR